jgi:hypothetical protein
MIEYAERTCDDILEVSCVQQVQVPENHVWAVHAVSCSRNSCDLAWNAASGMQC